MQPHSPIHPFNLVRHVNIRSLALPVPLGRRITPRRVRPRRHRLPIIISKIDTPVLVPHGAHDHHAGTHPGLDPRQQRILQQRKQQEMRQVVRRELRLEPVHRVSVRRLHDTRVAHQHAQLSGAALQHGRRRAPHARQLRLVHLDEVDAAVAGVEHVRERRPALRQVAHGRVDGRARGVQRADGGDADAGGGARDEDGLVRPGVEQVLVLDDGGGGGARGAGPARVRVGGSVAVGHGGVVGGWKIEGDADEIA